MQEVINRAEIVASTIYCAHHRRPALARKWSRRSFTPQRAAEMPSSRSTAAIPDTPPSRALRPRAGRVHRRDDDRRGKFALADGGSMPRRDRDLEHGGRRRFARSASSAARRRAHAAGRGPCRRGDQPRSQTDGERRPVQEDPYYRLKRVIPSRSRRCGNGATTSPRSSITLSRSIASDPESASIAWRLASSTRSAATTGRGTCANWRTRSNGLSSWRRDTC